MIKKDFYSIKEAAEIMGYSEGMVRVYIRKGVIKTEQMKKWTRHMIPWLELPTYARNRMLKK